MTDLEKFVNQPGRDKLVKDVRKKINDLKIEYIYYQFISVTGRIVGKGVPADHWESIAEKGFQLVYGATANLFIDRHGDYIGYGPEASELVGIPVDRLSLLTNCIEPFFSFPQHMSNTITYMPRKNQHFQREFFSLIARSSLPDRFAFKSLKGLSQAEVCSAFQDSICFLNFGYPEGFGLPVAGSASACGHWDHPAGA